MALKPKDIEKLRTCHDDLQLLVHSLADEMPIVVLEGHRDQAAQDAAVASGHSKTPFPTSKHNSLPSLAVDIAPLPLDWNNIDAFNKMMDSLERIAEKAGIEIRLGRTFSFKDYPHAELVNER